MANRFIDGTSASITSDADTYTVINGGTLVAGSAVPASDTITVDGTGANSISTASHLDISDSPDFHGNVTFSDGVIEFGDLTAPPTGPGFPQTDVTKWTLSGGELTLYTATGVAAQFAFNDISPEAKNGSQIVITEAAGQKGLYLTEGNAISPGGGADLIPGTVINPTTPPVVTPPTAPRALAVHDDTTGTPPSGATTPYTGPVAGIEQQFSLITPDNLNVTTFADNLFIKTGAGNDAIALHGGTNVVDAGGGSNFLVSGAGSAYSTTGSGFDTFFLDTRNIPAAASAAGPVPGAIWDTIQGFNHGDAATLFGVGPGTAFAWARNEGAAGHTGLTLHAIEPNGSTASLTLAGIDNGSHLQLSFGNTGGASYLYVKAV